MTSLDKLSQAVGRRFKKSESVWLAWSEVARILTEQEGIQPSLLYQITPTVEAVFGIKKSNKKGFPLEEYQNSGETIHPILEVYITSRLQADAYAQLTIETITSDFIANNPRVSAPFQNLCHLLARSIKRTLHVEKNPASSSWPLSFKSETVTLRPVTRRTYGNSLTMALSNSLRETQSLPPTPRGSREEKRSEQRLLRLCSSQSMSLPADLMSSESLPADLIPEPTLDDLFEDDSEEFSDMSPDEFQSPKRGKLVSDSAEADSLMPISVDGMKESDLRLIFLSLIPFIGGHYPARIPKNSPSNPNILQFGMRVNGLGAYFTFDGLKHLIQDSTAFGVAVPCPPIIHELLLAWFQKCGFEKIPLNQVSAQLIIRWDNQGAHYDDPNTVYDIVTLELARSGGLKIVNPAREFTGSYIWRGNAAKSFKHFGFVGPLPSYSGVQGRIALVFRTHLNGLEEVPKSGKVFNHIRCNELLSECIQKEISKAVINIQQSSKTHYDLCAKIITIGKGLLCMKPGGYPEGEGFGFCPSYKSVAGSMTSQELDCNLPGLQVGKELPESFLLPYGSFDSLWTLGFHRRCMGTTVHSSQKYGLISIAIRSENVYTHSACPLPLIVPQVSLQNIICNNGCCAQVKLSEQDQKNERLQSFSVEIRHCPYFYMIYPSSKVTGQRILSFSVDSTSNLKLKMGVPIPSLPEDTPFKCEGVEKDTSLIKHAMSQFEDGIILRSYHSNNGVTKSIYIGQVSDGVIHYARCNNQVAKQEELCEKCVKNREWLKGNYYENNRKRKRILQLGSKPPRKKVK